MIKIPKEIYESSQILDVKHEDVIQIPLEVIANGTPLSEELADTSKFVQLTYGGDVKTDDEVKIYVKADAIVQLVENGGKTFVFTVNGETPIAVKAGEILAKIGGKVYG